MTLSLFGVSRDGPHGTCFEVVGPCADNRNWPGETANPVGMVVSVVRSHGPGDVGNLDPASDPSERCEMTGGVCRRSDIGAGRLLEEKGTTPEPGGEARILIGRGRDTPMIDTPLPSFTTPTPVHDGEPRISFMRSVA
jgi:hypothetical protein